MATDANDNQISSRTELLLKKLSTSSVIINIAIPLLLNNFSHAQEYKIGITSANIN